MNCGLPLKVPQVSNSNRNLPNRSAAARNLPVQPQQDPPRQRRPQPPTVAALARRNWTREAPPRSPPPDSSRPPGSLHSVPGELPVAQRDHTPQTSACVNRTVREKVSLAHAKIHSRRQIDRPELVRTSEICESNSHASPLQPMSQFSTCPISHRQIASTNATSTFRWGQSGLRFPAGTAKTRTFAKVFVDAETSLKTLRSLL